MKFKNQTTNDKLQKMIDEENNLDGQIYSIENQINVLETQYL